MGELDDVIRTASLAIDESIAAGKLVFTAPHEWLQLPAVHFEPVGDPVIVTFDAVAPERAALIRAGRDCHVYWGTHGCHLERGHPADVPCRCDCECVSHPADDSGCVCAYPYYGDETRFWGEDVRTRGLPHIDD